MWTGSKLSTRLCLSKGSGRTEVDTYRAESISEQTTLAKWLAISQQAGRLSREAGNPAGLMPRHSRAGDYSQDDMIG